MLVVKTRKLLPQRNGLIYNIMNYHSSSTLNRKIKTWLYCNDRKTL